MRLNVVEQGTGDRTVVLLHGMMGSAESWWRVAELLADRGYRVLAVDLPGHGLSPRDPELSIPRAAAAVASTVAELTDEPPTVAIGFSYGGQILGAALPALRPGLAVFVDAPWISRGDWDRDEVAAEYRRDASTRTLTHLRASRPHYGERDCEVEARAAERFDPWTAAAVASAGGGAWPPPAGSIIVRADPSGYVDDEDAAAFTAAGVSVRSIPGAAHSIWYSHFDAFVASLPEVFG